MASYTTYTAARIARLVAAGELSAAEVCDRALEAVAAAEPDVSAFLEVSADIARRQAAAVDAAVAAGEKVGPLAGVPIAVKDNMNLVGTHTTCGSRMLENYESPYTATCVARVASAGAVVLGKTNMDEFAFGSSTESSYFGRTNNPWDLERVPGGSSGGSAAAVASGQIPVALGSDTGGSIRQPAAFCGIVGMKPTYGVVSRYGVVAFGSSLDQVGPFARTVEDAALVLDALTLGGKDPMDSTSQPAEKDYASAVSTSIEGKKVGVLPALRDAEGIAPEVRGALVAAEKALEAQGATLVEIELPHLDAAISAYYVIGPCEAFSNLARFDGVRYGYQEPDCSTLAEQSSLSRAHGFGMEAKRRQMLGAYLLSSGIYDQYYVSAQRARTLITEDYKKAYENVDVILMPVVPAPAFRFGEMADPTQMYLSDSFTISCNIAGNAGITVPMGHGGPANMPVAVQLQGPAFSDYELLGFAAALERGRGPIPAVAPAFAGIGGEL
jgi:aspartyl-tRNA(Asn)/glutamyl-tRNA(Gln) amidotransferase subunit A